MLISVRINGTSPDLLAIVVSVEDDVASIIFTMRIIDNMTLVMNRVR